MAMIEEYRNSEVNTIPINYLKDFLKKFLFDASVDMGTEFDEDRFLDRVYQIVTRHYGFVPLVVIEGAFARGALGFYGSGRLVPRTIFGWLREAADLYFQRKEVEKQKVTDGVRWDGLHKYPCGQAIILKMDLTQAGIISIEDWDKMPLMKIAEMIGRGERVTIEQFGLTDRRDEH